MAKGFSDQSNSLEQHSSTPSLVAATESEQVQRELMAHFEDLDDPRGKQGVLHPLISIVMIGVLATIGGAKGWEDIEVCAESHEQWLSSFLPLPFGIPSADTYRRLFEQINTGCPGAALPGLVEHAGSQPRCPGYPD